MLVSAVYFVHNDGRLMLSEIFQDTSLIPSEFILSTLLSSFKTISRELAGQYPQSLIMGEINYHFEDMEDYFVVIVTDERKKPDNLLFSLAMKFSSNFGHIIASWPGDMGPFISFRQTIFDEVAKYSNFDMDANIDPSKRLDSSELIFLPKHLKTVALVFLEHEKLTLGQIMEEVRREEKYLLISDIRKSIQELQEMGYVGVKVDDNQTPTYFI